SDRPGSAGDPDRRRRRTGDRRPRWDDGRSRSDGPVGRDRRRGGREGPPVSAAEAQALRTPDRARTITGGRLLTSGAIVVAGTGVFQISNFLFNSIAARALGPAGYGDLAAVIGIIYLA